MPPDCRKVAFHVQATFRSVVVLGGLRTGHDGEMLFRAVFLPFTATSRRDLVERLAQLVGGLFLYGVALGFMVRGGIGVAPWDVLSLGVAGWTGLGYGVVTVLISIVVLLLWIPLRQRVGLGTLLNALLIGPFADLTLLVLPAPPSVWVGAPCSCSDSYCWRSPPVSTSRPTSVPDRATDS